ncbi:lytic transglycosylase domain-containing protein [Herbiconiux sp. YIM B11900]|uniref:lytic transglycosylase domain-containing protein n=1 Tax=Herbiconiux sp. YIM B11900 TaxID=3404131 RepID=UPI003F83B9BB
MDSTAGGSARRRGVVVALLAGFVVLVVAAVVGGVALGGGWMSQTAAEAESTAGGASGALAEPDPAEASSAPAEPDPADAANAATPTAGAGTGTTAGVGAAPLASLPDPAWAADVALATGIPIRALLAYAGAEIRLREEQPTCHLSWNTLAAIGFVESEHGTLYGGAIGDDGRADPPIIGIALNGDGVDAIADTERGALDGDAVWDRAVGPMQFLPSTWESAAADGDGDGIRDPHDIDDAALAAGRYLCVGGVDLRDDAAWVAAVVSYNSSIDYNNRVASAADVYAASSTAASAD